MDYTRLVRKAIDYMQKQSGENILVLDISQQVHLSPSYFAYVFMKLLLTMGSRLSKPLQKVLLNLIEFRRLGFEVQRCPLTRSHQLIC